LSAALPAAAYTGFPCQSSGHFPSKPWVSSRRWIVFPFPNYPMGLNGFMKSYVVKVIMWCRIILAATFASELVLQRNIIWNLLNTLNSATHYSPILASEYTRLLPPGTAI
jgi:hypothetical protein